MNKNNTINTIMSKDLITVHPSDKLTKVKEIFSEKSIHHLPVVEFKTLVGIVSKSDFHFFQRGSSNGQIKEQLIENVRYRNYEVN